MKTGADVASQPLQCIESVGDRDVAVVPPFRYALGDDTACPRLDGLGQERVGIEPLTAKG